MALEEISAQIVNMLQEISRKLNGVLRSLRDDEPQAAQACVESY